MFNFFLFVILMFFFSGVYAFFSNMDHLLMVLMSLEFIILSIFFLLYIYLLIFSFESYFLLYFLVLSVSESVLGLSLLVGLVRSEGNDRCSSLMML